MAEGGGQACMDAGCARGMCSVRAQVNFDTSIVGPAKLWIAPCRIGQDQFSALAMLWSCTVYYLPILVPKP